MLEYELIFNCIKLSEDTPIFLTESMIDLNTRISLIGDISCEATHLKNPMPIYSEPTNFNHPVCQTSRDIDIMAIDNITTMLPMECSEILSEQIFPYLCYFLMAQGCFKKSAFERVVNAFKTASEKAKTSWT